MALILHICGPLIGMLQIALANKFADFVIQYSLDGIDIDYEVWTFGCDFPCHSWLTKTGPGLQRYECTGRQSRGLAYFVHQAAEV
jgi:hypothetical protein